MEEDGPMMCGGCAAKVSRSELMAARRRQIDRIRVLLDEEQRAQYDQRDPSRRLGEVR